MRKLDIVQWGSDRLRVGTWRGDAAVAQIVPAPGQLPRVATIDRCLDELATRGYRSALTSALTYGEQQPFLDAGFEVHERLHLLRHGLRNLPPVAPRRSGATVRRGRRRDRAGALRVDGAAFAPFWRFDERGLEDARAATPSARFRVVDGGGVDGGVMDGGGVDGGGRGHDNEVVGYAITGRAGSIGYLQRLAVLPDHQRRGIGYALVIDGLLWARRRGSTSVLVNTQETNEAAVRLYEHMGFTREAYGLAVLERPLRGVEETA